MMGVPRTMSAGITGSASLITANLTHCQLRCYRIKRKLNCLSSGQKGGQPRWLPPPFGTNLWFFLLLIVYNLVIGLDDVVLRSGLSAGPCRFSARARASPGPVARSLLLRGLRLIKLLASRRERLH